MPAYSASGTVVPSDTRRATRVARRFSKRRQFWHNPPIAMPAVSAPHFAHGGLGPNSLDHGAGEFGRRSTSPQVRRPDIVRDDRVFERAPQPLRPVELPHMIEHH